MRLQACHNILSIFKPFCSIGSRPPGSILLFIALCITPFEFFAQNENDLVEDNIIQVPADPELVWDMSFAFKTMNVFRGLLPSRAPTFSTQAGIAYNRFILGFYGGASFNGVYTETDLIAMYYRPKWDVHLEWYYNFTEGITNIPAPSGFFDFNPETTRGLLDLIFHLRPSEGWLISSSTFLYGRDRPSLPEDDASGIPLRRGDQRYTQYLEVAYNWKRGKNKLQVHIGGSFSWNDPSGPTFYGDRPGLNNMGVSFSRTLLRSESITLPIKATAYLNAVTNNIYLVATIQIIEISRLLQ